MFSRRSVVFPTRTLNRSDGWARRSVHAWWCVPLALLPVVAQTALPAAASAQSVTQTQVIARTVAAFTDQTDQAGHVWKARRGLIGGTTNSSTLVGKPIAGTTDDNLYQVSSYTSTGYALTVPAGRYRVRLLMAEGYWSAPGKRVFNVTAEGQTVLSQVDIFGAAGKATAYDQTFETDVNDGTLNVGFVKVLDNPLIAAVEVSSVIPADPTTPPALGHAPIPLGPTSPFITRIEQAPLDPQSTEIAANLRSDVVNNWGGVAAVNTNQYNSAFYQVPADQPRVDVDFWNCQNKTWVDPALFQPGGFFMQVPVPSDAVPATGTDGEMSIYSPSTDQLWEFWRMRRNTSTNRWEACWVGRIDNVSQSIGVHKQWYGVSASGLAVAAGMISLDEVRRGRIDHAMYLGAMNIRAYPDISWPANRGDGNVTDGTPVVREGQRLRLDPALDLSTLSLTPVGRMIAEAAQKYGFIVCDRSGAVAVITESGAREKSVTGVDPWPSLLGMPSYEVLRNFPWASIQAVAVDYGKP
ncbi:hypothetical protein KEM60_00769 [Austwickia sp. TVS 96-490-7B]|uniref:malectin domain-containing carbohydrate-binding protein n=1 Tax=Austwickia sp. TVS 96-490-7B TaxID=2830843 RepID=UPI001C572129|nr:malectin domain-containing carbohydrate-binding protein [Austwickia sp. TVS 96-490-7B]MBW3084581.1 hypothetical protein [Austwickia sp. TVS 96-490-7B]